MNLKEVKDNLPEHIPFESLGIVETWVKEGNFPRKTFKNSLQNAIILLDSHPHFSDKIKYNEWDLQVYYEDEPVEDYQVIEIIVFIAGQYRVDFSKNTIIDALKYVSKSYGYNPFIKHLNSIPIVREDLTILDTWLVDYFGVKDLPIFRTFGRKWAIGNIARSVFSTLKNPIQHDLCLLIQGEQGAGKSTALRKLAMKTEWFSDIPLDMSNFRESAIKIQGIFIYEMKELAKRAGIEAEKAFIDTRVDKFRPMYGKTDVRVVRKCNLAATTNYRSNIFKDSSGSRRWLGVVATNIRTRELGKIADKLWAAALYLLQRETIVHEGKTYNAFQAIEDQIPGYEKFIWWLTANEEKARKTEAQLFTSEHPLSSKVKEYCIKNPIDITPAKIINYLDLPMNQRNKKMSSTIAFILNDLGYHKTRVWESDGTRPTKWVKK